MSAGSCTSRPWLGLVLLTLALPCTSLRAQSPVPAVPAPPARRPYFLDPSTLPLAPLLRTPPADGTAEAQAELARMHEAEVRRTEQEVKAARYDDTHEDIFLYAPVVGAGFSADRLPLTLALSKHLRNDAGLIDNPLKEHFARLRPYNADPSLHPVCETNREMSYPSGHSINGFLYAYTLAEMLPELHDAILARADEYAHHRVVCGSHFPSDTEASRRVADLIFGALLVNPRFRQELELATAETRSKLSVHPTDSLRSTGGLR